MKIVSIFIFFCCNSMVLLAQKSNSTSTTVKSTTKAPSTKKNVPIIKDAPTTNVPVINTADDDLLPIKPTPQKNNNTKTNVPIIKDAPTTNVPVINDADDDLLPIKPTPPKNNNTNVPIIKDAPTTNVPVINAADDDLLPIKPTPPKNNNTKTNVPIIKDAPKANVPVINAADDDLLPIKPNKAKPVKKGNTNVPILTEADELLDVKSNEPDPNDLLDIKVPTTKPSTPNAGTNVFDKLLLTSNYSFNKKMGVNFVSDEGVWQGDFYLNTKTGYSFLPNNSLQNIAKADGQIDQIMGPKAEFYQYTKSSEGNFSMQMDNPSSYVTLTEDSKNKSKNFFSNFKRTNKKINIGGRKQFKCVIYNGKDDDGNSIDVYLASAGDIRIDIKKTYVVTGHFGLGYIAAPSGNTYLIAGVVGKTGSIFLNYLENESTQFAGSKYTPIGQHISKELMAKEADKAEELNAEEINNETDPQLKLAKIKAAEVAKKLNDKNKSATEKFIKTSDMQNLPGVSTVNDIQSTEDYYNFLILAFEEKAAENNKSIKELKEDANNNQKALQELYCMNGCNTAEIQRYKNLKDQHITILKKYNVDKNEDRRDEAIEKLMQKNIQLTLVIVNKKTKNAHNKNILENVLYKYFVVNCFMI